MLRVVFLVESQCEFMNYIELSLIWSKCAFFSFGLSASTEAVVVDRLRGPGGIAGSAMVRPQWWRANMLSSNKLCISIYVIYIYYIYIYMFLSLYKLLYSYGSTFHIWRHGHNVGIVRLWHPQDMLAWWVNLPWIRLTTFNQLFLFVGRFFGFSHLQGRLENIKRI